MPHAGRCLKLADGPDGQCAATYRLNDDDEGVDDLIDESFKSLGVGDVVVSVAMTRSTPRSPLSAQISAAVRDSPAADIAASMRD